MDKIENLWYLIRDGINNKLILFLINRTSLYVPTITAIISKVPEINFYIKQNND